MQGQRQPWHHLTLACTTRIVGTQPASGAPTPYVPRLQCRAKVRAQVLGALVRGVLMHST